MPRKMQTAVVEQFGKPLMLREWDVPSPGPGQIVVKTEARGVCHTDLHAARGDWPVKPSLPFIPGHEGIWWKPTSSDGRCLRSTRCSVDSSTATWRREWSSNSPAAEASQRVPTTRQA